MSAVIMNCTEALLPAAAGEGAEAVFAVGASMAIGGAATSSSSSSTSSSGSSASVSSATASAAAASGSSAASCAASATASASTFGSVCFFGGLASGGVETLWPGARHSARAVPSSTARDHDGIARGRRAGRRRSAGEMGVITRNAIRARGTRTATTRVAQVSSAPFFSSPNSGRERQFV